MDKRASLMRQLQAAQTPQEQGALVARLDQLEQDAALRKQASTELGFASGIVEQRMTPVRIAVQHTGASDWIGGIDTSGAPDCVTDMTVQAGLWFRRTSAAVKADPEEYAEQARGMARHLAGAHGEQAPVADSVFRRQAAILWRGENHRLAASGIPQIDQLIDPNNQPGATPYPAEVFDNFAPPVHPVNEGIESESGQGWASSQAPMIQTLENMNGGGSGFGAGPEKPDEHDVDNDVDGANSYAEVPLGQPGTLPTGRQGMRYQAGESAGCSCCQAKNKDGKDPQGECPSCGHMNKSHGGRKTAARMTSPDEAGFQWPITMTADVHGAAGWDVDTAATPFHKTCGRAHEPWENCVSHETSREAVAQCSECHHPAHGNGKCSQSGSGCTCHGPRNASLADYRTPSPTLAMGYQYNLDDFRHAETIRMQAASQAEARFRHLANQYIKQQGGKWVILQKDTGKVLSHHDSEEQANASFRAMMQSKHGAASGTGVDNDEDARPAYEGWQTGPVGDQDHDTWDEGGLQDRDAHEAAKSGMRPHPRSCYGFGRMDALDGKPPVDPETYQHVFKDMSGSLHGHYMAGYQSVGNERDDLAQKHESSLGSGLDPTGARNGRTAASGLTQVQEVVDANNRPDPENDQLPQATMFPWTISQGDGQSLPGPEAAPKDVSRVAQAARMAQAALDGDGPALRKWADQFTAPHQTTDDDNPVANSPDTTPHPASGAAAAGTRDGTRDRQQGNRPTFSDASSHASDYVRSYSEAYATPGQPAAGGDMPYSAGGDSGQAANSQEARQLAQVNKAAGKHSAPGAPDQGPAKPGQVPSHSAGGDDDDDDDPDAWAFEGKRKAPVVKLTASRAFVPSGALPDVSFRRGYVAGRNFQQCGLPVLSAAVPPLSSPAFESGLLAGITDGGPVRQRAFVAAHRALARRGRSDLMERISAHQEFAFRLARQDPAIVVRGSYVQAATSSDLATTAPGTSPDPMGSTPLNGPGTPPPMQGGSNPGRPGGAPPYQGAPPFGSGPVAPDPVMGDQQPAPPPTGEVMGGEGYSGYINDSAYQGSPRGGSRQAAFRARVQAALAAGKGSR